MKNACILQFLVITISFMKQVTVIAIKLKVIIYITRDDVGSDPVQSYCIASSNFMEWRVSQPRYNQRAQYYFTASGLHNLLIQAIGLNHELMAIYH
jgi:hypothetical protein